MGILARGIDARNELDTAHLKADLRGRSVRGGLLTIISQGSQFIITSISTVVLARLLTPTDFGLVAMVSAVTVLASGFGDLGLSEATIQRKEVTHNQVSCLFWINVAIGLALTIIIASLSPVLAKVYRDPRIIGITLTVSITFLIAGLRVQPDALLKRQMRFSSIAARDIFSSAFGVTVGILVAKKGFGYWALVALPLTSNLSLMTLSWLLVRWRPSWPHRDPTIRSMVAFGGNVAASYFVINIDRSADNALIGWHWGAAPLGLYARAYNLLMLPVRQLSAPASSVAVPAFSRLQNEPEVFSRYYLRAINLLLWIGAPLFAFLFVAARPVIRIALGRQWGDAAPVFQILVISALGQLLLESSIWLFISRGQSALLLRLLLLLSPILIASFAVGLPFGIKGVALLGSITLLLILPWMLHRAFRGTPLTLWRLGSILLCPIGVSVAGGVVAEFALRLSEVQKSVSQLAVAAVSVLAICMVSMMIPVVRKELSEIRNLVNNVRRPRETPPVSQ